MLTIFQVHNERVSNIHQNVSFHLCTNSIPHCDEIIHNMYYSILLGSPLPFSDAFLRTFIAYILPASLSLIFLTRNTCKSGHHWCYTVTKPNPSNIHDTHTHTKQFPTHSNTSVSVLTFPKEPCPRTLRSSN